jgi:hypothetical protein
MAEPQTDEVFLRLSGAASSQSLVHKKKILPSFCLA